MARYLICLLQSLEPKSHLKKYANKFQTFNSIFQKIRNKFDEIKVEIEKEAIGKMSGFINFQRNRTSYFE